MNKALKTKIKNLDITNGTNTKHLGGSMSETVKLGIHKVL
jgi:hypothetical protein